MKTQSLDIDFLIQNKFKNPDVLQIIENKNLFFDGLNDLNNVIGMKSLKEDILTQTLKLIENKKLGVDIENMLNMVIYGPPGVGKTKIGIVISKIMMGIGVLDSRGSSSSVTEFFDQLTDKSKMEKYLNIGIILFYGVSVLRKIKDKIQLKYFMILVVSICVLLAIVGFMYFSEKQKMTKSEKDREIVKVVSREDFVAEYVGQTAPKTKNLLRDNLGKVLFIDEAYSLYQGIQDLYGKEALDTLNLFMSENQGKIIVVFAGYQQKLENGIFRIQPGLVSRCMWHFECKPYSSRELAKIFFLQVNLQNVKISTPRKIKKYIIQNYKNLKSFGRDTSKLLYFSDLEKTKRLSIKQKGLDGICLGDVKIGMKKLMQNNVNNSHTYQSKLEKVLDFL